MSAENVEIMRTAYEAIARRDRETLDAILRERLAPDFEFEAALTGATYRGLDGFWELLDDIEDTVGYGRKCRRPSIWATTCWSCCGCPVAVRGAVCR